MANETTAPRIYAACLASYNNGRLHGGWIDCADKEGDDIRAEIAAILATSPTADAEEWAIHDHEGFAGLITSEGPDIDEVAAMAKGLASGDRFGFLWLVQDHGMTPSEAIDEAENVQVFQSDKHDLPGDYAYDLASDTIEDFDAKSSQWPFTCIDWEAAGRELVLGGDVVEFEADGERMLITNPHDF